MLFLSDVFAAGETVAQVPGKQNAVFNILLLGVFIFVLYLLIWRPQNKRMKAVKMMLDGLKPDDEIVTNGGILGRIKQIDNNIVEVVVSKEVVIQVQKTAIALVLPKGTLQA